VGKIIGDHKYPVIRLTVLAGCFFIIGIFIITENHGAELVDRIVAVVNNDIISLQELNRITKPYVERIKENRYSNEKEQKMLFEIRRKILDQLIDEKLTDQELKRHNITVSTKEIDRTIERIKETASITDEELRTELASQGLTMEEYRVRTKEHLLRRKLINREVRSKIVITQEDIKAYYDSHMDDYAGKKKYHLRNIIMKVSLLASDTEKQTVFTRMENVLEKLEQGEDFAKLAKIYSQSSMASEGGDLGFFQLDEISPLLRPEIEELKAGEFTSVIDTEMGYQIFLVEEVVEKPGKSLEDATPEITDKLYTEIVDQKYQAWLENLRTRSHIKIIN
jgi:peptidyl-prolyl cis-trans isomerase SurA